MDLITALTIALSVVSIVVTLIGFFASLKFYRDGIDLQAKASDALTKIEEKTQFIQVQVGGLFDKTLDAAIGKREVLAQNFEALNTDLETLKTKVIEESVREIGAAGEYQQQRLAQIVDGQIDLIRQRIETARASAEKIAEDANDLPQVGSLAAIVNVLIPATDGLTLKEIAKKVAYGESWVRWRLAQLKSAGKVEARGGKYYLMPMPDD